MRKPAEHGDVAHCPLSLSRGDLSGEPLRVYVTAIAEALGVGSESISCCGDETPASAYIALRERCDDHPDRDLALIWDESHGWALAMETASAEDLIVLRYYDGEPGAVASPRAIAAFVDAAIADRAPHAGTGSDVHRHHRCRQGSGE